MAVYEVLNDSNEVINTISADASFMAANYESYRVVAPHDNTERNARAWRNLELQKTDFIVPLSDHPQRTAYMSYRTTLRNWPSTDEFPETRPNDPNYVARVFGETPPDPE